jgi:cytochrome b561
MTNLRHYKHSPVTQTIHWLTAILVLVAFTYGPGGPQERVYSTELDFDRHLHETLGMAVFTLTVLRILWKLFDTRPQPLALKRWMEIASKAVQGFLYLLLLAVPLTAVLGAWLEGHSIELLYGLRIAPQIGSAPAQGALVAEIHGWLGDCMLWLAGAHAAAAIYHRVVLKDAVLGTMLPNWVEEKFRTGNR